MPKVVIFINFKKQRAVGNMKIYGLLGKVQGHNQRGVRGGWTTYSPKQQVLLRPTATFAKCCTILHLGIIHFSKALNLISPGYIPSSPFVKVGVLFTFVNVFKFEILPRVLFGWESNSRSKKTCSGPKVTDYISGLVVLLFQTAAVCGIIVCSNCQ